MDTDDRIEFVLDVKTRTAGGAGRGGTQEHGEVTLFTLQGPALELARKAVLQGVIGKTDRTEAAADQRIANHVKKSVKVQELVHTLLGELVKEGQAEAARKAADFLKGAPAQEEVPETVAEAQ